jgi:hypothetical protein
MAAADKDIKTGFNTPAVVLCGAAAVVFLFAMALFIQGGFMAAQAKEYEVKVYAAPVSEAVRAAVAEQQAILNEKVRWKDQEEGTVVMPIEDAMEQIVNNSGDSQ